MRARIDHAFIAVLIAWLPGLTGAQSPASPPRWPTVQDIERAQRVQPFPSIKDLSSPAPIPRVDFTRGNLDIELSLDTETAGWWDDGLVYVYFQQSQGRTLTAQYVGDGQFYSNIDTSPKPQWLTQLGEYWYQHTFGDDELVVRLGRLDPNTDFAYPDLGWDFINSSFITLPNIPMPYWPFQQLGVTALYQPHERLRLGGGAYDNGRDVGQWWVSTTTRGMFFIAQADYMPFADCDSAPLTINVPRPRNRPR